MRKPEIHFCAKELVRRVEAFALDAKTKSGLLARMNPHASALGRLAKGKKKTLTKAERRRRAEQMRAVGKRNRKKALDS